MSALIYVETSIPSFYHETRPEAQFQAMREWTREWWDIARLRDELVTSEAVLLELGRAPEAKRVEGLALIEPLPLLDIVEAVDELVAVYLAHRLMPRDAEGDAMHLALATFYECDTLATWNCRHIANVNKREHIQRVNASLGFATPLLTTPFELLEQLP
jgi:predicted nucleic acid-binding protein